MMNSSMLDARGNLSVYPDIPLGDFIGYSVGVSAGIGVIANILVLVVLTISQRRRFSPYRYLISHLAFSDMVCSVFLLVYVPVELANHNWTYGKVTCKVIYPAITFCANIAVGTILIISYERYRGMFIHLSPWKRNNVWVALLVVWIVSFAMVVPNALTLKVTEYQNIVFCNEVWASTKLQRAYGLSFFFITFFIPLLAVAFMHGSIMLRLKRRDLRPANISQWQVKTDTRIMRVLSAVIFAFLICTAPNKLLYFVWDIQPKLEKDTESKTRFYLRTIQILYYLRVAVDPLLYCFYDTRFKKDFRNTVKAVRGLTFIDSEIQKSRSRTMSQLNNGAVNQRSRASSYINGEAQLDFNNRFSHADIIARLQTVPEAKTEISTPHRVVLEERLRSDSCDTVDQNMCGSSSPLVNAAFVSDSQDNGKNIK